MANIAYFCYHRKDDNVLETCINSLKLVNPLAIPMICTDGVPEELEERFEKEYNVRWIKVPEERMKNRRATCKIEILQQAVQKLSYDDNILVSDVDVYFISDPFKAFTESHFDLGLTTRGYKHLFPINAGIFYIKLNERMRRWIDWHVLQIHNPAWPPYKEAKRTNNHYRFGLDWTVGQDFLIACWNARTELLSDKGINVVDVGCKYNYCPATDLFKGKAFEMAWNALNGNEKGIITLHLKSDLKKMIYESNFPNAKLNYPKGTTAWL